MDHSPLPVTRSAHDAPTIALTRSFATALPVSPAALEAWTERFALLHELGRGGMGVVHAALDHRLGREVALKILIADAHNQTALARFVREAQLTGQLSHPHIPPVYELGRTADGSPYFAMKLVRGRSLRHYLDDLRARPRDRQCFPLERRLEILTKVALALAFAHDRGVIHRDLKPDNVMVGEFGEVQVMDWGLAKLTGHPDTAGAAALTSYDVRATPSLTLDGDIAGTPAYMAPEQAHGELDRLDVRTDVFALGALLYEMLALAPPYAGSTVFVIIELAGRGAWVPVLERIRASPSPRPPRPPRELAAIAHRALASDPNERYADVAAFLADVRAYQAHQSVAAHADGVVARAIKWTQRRPRAALALACALVIALVTSQLAAARARAEAEAQHARADASEARAAQDQAEAATARSELARQAEHVRAESLGQLVHAELSAETSAAIDEFTRLWDAARRRGLSDDVFQRSLNAAQVARFVDGYDRLFRAHELTGTAPRVGDYISRAILRMAHGDVDGAIADYGRALAIDPRLTGVWNNRGSAHHVKGDLDRAVDDFDQALALEPEHAAALSNRGSVRAEKGDLEGAIADFDRAVLVAPRDSHVIYNRGLARAARGELDLAIADFGRVIALRPEYAEAWGSRGDARRAKGELDLAIADLDRAIALEPELATAWNSRGNAHRLNGELDLALADLDRAVALSPRDPVTFSSRAVARLVNGDVAGAIADCDQALSVQPRHAPALDTRGNARSASGDLAGALADFDQVLAIEPRSPGTLCNRGSARLGKGDVTGAIADYGAALAVERSQGATRPRRCDRGLRPSHRASARLRRCMEQPGDRAPGKGPARRRARRLRARAPARAPTLESCSQPRLDSHAARSQGRRAGRAPARPSPLHRGGGARVAVRAYSPARGCSRGEMMRTRLVGSKHPGHVRTHWLASGPWWTRVGEASDDLSSGTAAPAQGSAVAPTAEVLEGLLARPRGVQGRASRRARDATRPARPRDPVLSAPR